MNQKTRQITYGAMLIAIFAIIMLLNRQTGGLLDNVTLYILPIPIAVYAVLYGGRPGSAVFACMCIVSFLFGGYTSIFYGISAALIGLVYGICLHRKADMTRTLILVVAMTVVTELVSLVLIAAVSGIGIEADIQYMQEILNQTAEQYGMELPETLIGSSSLRRLLLLAVTAQGALEGFVINGLTILVLRRLRIPAPSLTPVTSVYPPAWTGLLAGGLWLLYTAVLNQQVAIERGLADGTVDSFLNRCINTPYVAAVLQIVGMACWLYLAVFGAIALSMILRKYVTKSKAGVAILAVIAFMMFSNLLVWVGIFYISGTLHDRLLDRKMTL